MTLTNRRALFVITPGDPDGIGPEITWKALQSGDYRRRGVELLCVGARKPFDEMGVNVVTLELKDLEKIPNAPILNEPFVWLLPAPTKAPASFRGKKKPLLEGFQSGWSIEKATELALSGEARAIITGPISKERLQKGGFKYPGHTEMLADLCSSPRKKKGGVVSGGTPDVVMMLANDQLRVSLATTHLGLKDVSRALTRRKI